MAKGQVNCIAQCEQIVTDLRAGRFAPIYLLMGDEPYYPEMVCREIIDHCIAPDDKDFNETVCYGTDTDAAGVVSAARRYPMMAERQLVVVKEAQKLSKIDDLNFYCSEPLDSTVLVLLMHGASLDKRLSLYKSIKKNGIVVESSAIRDYEVAGWISNYYSSRGLQIDPRAAALLGEYAGTDLGKIVVETDKLLKNLPEGSTRVSTEDIERNVGISRQYSIFELSSALSLKKPQLALKIASHLASDAKFYMPMCISALFVGFSRILKYASLLQRSPRPSAEEKARALAGVNPYFYKEYDSAVRNYPIPKAMAAVSLLCQYDHLSKGGDGALVDQSELFVELVAKILNL